MLLSLLTFLGSARADAAMEAPEDCTRAYVVVSLPATGATDVPLDAVPALLLAGNGVCSYIEWTVTLTGGTTTQSQIHTAGRLVEIFPEAPLEPNTDYVVRIEPADGAGEASEIGFRTGEALATGLVGIPAIQDLEVFMINTDGDIEGEGTILAADSSDGVPYIVALEDEAGFRYALQGTSAQTIPFALDIEGHGEEELCLYAAQRDILGEWFESAAACAVPEALVESDDANPCGGCATGGGGAGFGALIALLFIRRRR